MKDGEIKGGMWFDQGRIETIGDGIQAAEVKSDKPGGEYLASPEERA